MSTEPATGHPGAEVVQLRAAEVADEAQLAGARTPVYLDATAERAGQRLPIIPEPWQRANLRATLARLGGLHWHRAGYHGIRTPAVPGDEYGPRGPGCAPADRAPAAVVALDRGMAAGVPGRRRGPRWPPRGDARAHRGRLHPLVLAVDEVQEAFASEYRDEFEKYFLAIIKRGPALGITLVLATQRPDTKSLPTAISANIGMRFCLRVMDQVANDMVLGTSAYKRGINATLLALSDKGCGWAVGFADEPQVVKTYNVDGPAAGRVCDAARAARQAAGRLTGHAAGELDGAEAPRSFAADALAVFDAEAKLYTATIAGRLAERIPGAYADITAAAVASQLCAVGVTVRNVREPGGKPGQGCDRADVEAAAGVH